MSTNWYISTNSTSWATLAASGIENCVLTLRTNGVDDLSFQVKGDYLSSEAFAHGSTVYLASGADTAHLTCRFVGRITSVPRQAMSTDEVVTYRASGGWWWLDQIIYFVQWQYMRTSDNALVNTSVPRVILGQDNDGNPRSMDAEVTAAIAWAIGRGAPILSGTIDSLATCPYSEHTNISCGEVVRQAIRLQPDTVCWFDYNTKSGGVGPYVPTFNCRAPSGLSTANIGVSGGAVDQVSMTPRYDLQMPGITIYYESTNTYNGHSNKSVALDTAGTTSDARSVSLLVELNGFSTQTVQQAITVTAYPVSLTDKTFWRALVPWLSGIADADLNISSATRSGSMALGNYLVEGQISPWMNVSTEAETFTATISYTHRTSGTADEAVVNKQVSVKLLSCGGTTRTYQGILSYTAAEAQPSGVAAAMYASWGRLQWDGSFRIFEQEATFQCAPGYVVNLTGGLSDWSSMAAIVQQITVDIGTGITSVQTGTCGRLQADSLVALWRGVHFRRFAYSAVSRTDAGASGSMVTGGANLARQTNSEADPGQHALLRLQANSTESLLQTINLNPAGIVHAASGDRTNRTLQPREVMLPFVDANGVPQMQLAQVLCSAQYGSATKVNAATITSILDVLYPTLSPNGVSSDTAETTTWTAGSTPGQSMLLEWMTRVAYNSGGDKKLYGFVRPMQFDPSGHLVGMGAEYRVTLDTPTAYP